MPEKHAEFFKTYCVRCHGPEEQNGQVRLDTIPFDLAQDLQTADTWQKILNALNAGEMPPVFEKQPTNEEKAAFLEELSEKMVTVRSKLADSGGVAVMRRLNRREYQNTIRSLLGVTVDVSDLPNDAGGGNFDTVGASLYVSPAQLERYLKLGRQSLEEAFVRETRPAPQPETTRIELEEWGGRQAEEFYSSLREYYKNHLKWVAAEDRPATDFGFQDEARAKRAPKRYFKNAAPHYTAYRLWPHTDSGVYFNKIHSTIDPGFTEDHPPGEYRVRVRIGATEDAPANRRFVDLGLVVDLGGREDFKILESYQITGTRDRPQVLEIPVTITKYGPRDFVLREMRPDYGLREKWKVLREALNFDEEAPDGADAETQVKWVERRLTELMEPGGELDSYVPDPVLWVDWVEIEGPFATQWPEEHRRIFFRNDEAPKDEAYAREIITRFARRAFRGKEPRNDYLDRVVAIYEQHRADGATFEDAVKESLAVVLASPDFLYLSKAGPAGTETELLTDRELAVRLAYFLWSAPPDEALLAAARDGSLSRPEELRAQVDRMLDDPQSWEFVTGFAHQWLDLDRIDLFQFDENLYPDFGESTKIAAVQEVYHTVDTLLREDLSARHFLKSDFVVVNGLLAQYYGIEGVAGDEWRKVPAPPKRGGLLSMAATLAMGSDGEQTNPVERGAFVLRKLLNDPPPPAPANVPQLSRLEEEALSMRERLQVHQEQAQCVHCHRKIDPIGFGLENFDAAGQWRSEETIFQIKYNKRGRRKKKEVETRPIDAGGKLHEGPLFENYIELREVLASRTDAFSRGLIEALLEYALGRPVSFSDEELITRLHEDMKQDDYRLRSLIHRITQSREFQSK